MLGDLHGYRHSVQVGASALQLAPQLQASPNAVVVQLGDVGDRGPDSVLVTHDMALAKVVYGQQVRLVRGNHEVSQHAVGGGRQLSSCAVHAGRPLSAASDGQHRTLYRSSLQLW